MFALLVVNKPTGITSRSVVNRVQRLVRPDKVGHAGTLDPLAVGVLVLGIGRATRLVQYVQRMPKQYTGTFLLGKQSETDDTEGTVIDLPAPPQPTREQIDANLAAFTGPIEQVPPAFSAIKVAGRRSYELARKGKAVALSARPVMIHSLGVREYEYPRLVLDMKCGSGTYVRAVGRDLARHLGTEAVMSALVRTAIGSFTLDEAFDLSDISADTLAGQTVPPARAVQYLPSLTLTAEELREIENGRTIINRTNLDTKEIVALDESGRLAAIMIPRGTDRLGPWRNFLSREESLPCQAD